MMVAPTVVFDLDGTLVDSAPDLVATLNVIFAREGLPPVAYDTARNLVGGGARSMIERSLAAQERNLDAALDQLAAGGCRFAVCTNKLEWLSVRLLDALGLSNRFAAICGADTFGLQKPHPDLLRRTIARAGGEPGHAVMVGDSISDIATARAAGVPVVAVDHGYTETPVSELGPDRVISTFAELPSAVFDLLRADSPTAANRR